jgi:hypothetical protein
MSRVLGDLRVSRALRDRPWVSTWAQGDVGLHQDWAGALVAVGDLTDSSSGRELKSRARRTHANGPAYRKFGRPKVLWCTALYLGTSRARTRERRTSFALHRSPETG